MAQELLDIYPEAVILDESGYFSVNYASIGLEMLTYEQWLMAKKSKETLV